MKTSSSVSQPAVSMRRGSVTVTMTVETGLTNKTAVSYICVYLSIVLVYKTRKEFKKLTNLS